MKTYRAFKEAGLDDKLDKYVSNEIKKRKLAKFPVNATDDSWDEQLVNNIKIKKIHVIEVKSYEDADYVVHDDITKVGNWPIEYYDASVELEIYTRQVVKKEIGK